MQPLIVTLPYCSTDAQSALRLLDWMHTLDGIIDHHCLLLVADNAVPLDVKKSVQAKGKEVFTQVETIMPQCPTVIGANYHVPAAVMFERSIAHIDTCYKWNFVWVEPDAVPLKSGWLDTLSDAYDRCPKRFMGPVVHTTQPDVPQVHMPATMVYPNCSHSELKKFCDGKQAFDMAFAGHVVPRGQETPLIFHRWGNEKEAPTFKDFKMPTDGPNVGTLDMIPAEAVLFHRCKDGTLIELLKAKLSKTEEPEMNALSQLIQTASKRGPGRPKSVPVNIEGIMP